jgi:hypothetical protein
MSDQTATDTSELETAIVAELERNPAGRTSKQIYAGRGRLVHDVDDALRRLLAAGRVACTAGVWWLRGGGP